MNNSYSLRVITGIRSRVFLIVFLIFKILLAGPNQEVRKGISPLFLPSLVCPLPPPFESSAPSFRGQACLIHSPLGSSLGWPCPSHACMTRILLCGSFPRDVFSEKGLLLHCHKSSCLNRAQPKGVPLRGVSVQGLCCP